MIPTFIYYGLHIGNTVFIKCQVFVFDLDTIERETNVRIDFTYVLKP